jgi:ATP-binding cassette subfamily B protein
MRYNLASAEKDSEVTGKLADTLTNETAVKLFGGLTLERKRFVDVTEELRVLRFKAWTFDEYINMGQGLLSILLEFGLIYAGIKLWLAGAITIGDFALIQSYILASFLQLWNFGNSVRRIFSAYADATEIVDIMNMPLEIQDAADAKELHVSAGTVEFRDVDFSFNVTNNVLKHFDLSIKSREKVALVGPSGAGKTTITKLLLRLHDVSGGGIYIDNQNIALVYQDSLRNNISLVPQDPVLFHRTLRENIAYGKQDATMDEIVEAAKKAHCHEFILRLPEGYETYVGERGVKLSGGERQRVAIARAILKNAPILVLDEATSSLDSESESLIQDALIKLMEGKTVIAIAHRLSTVMKMDRIIVMEQGKVVLSGTHEELLAQESNLYKKLWEIQAGGFITGKA